VTGQARRGDPVAYARRTLSNLRIDTWRKHRREVLVGEHDPFAASVPSGAQGHAERALLAANGVAVPGE